VNIQITPSTLQGVVHPPASKSMMHRALFLALLAKGTTILRDVSLSDDVWASISAIQSFGAQVKVDEPHRMIEIVSHELRAPTQPIHCKESGTTLRFVCAIAATFDEPITITGEVGLLGRPMDGYTSLFHSHQVRFETTTEGYVIQGPLQSNKAWVVDGTKSSQFLSGLLLAAVRYDQPIQIEVLERISSAAYADMTSQIMQEFGVVIAYSLPIITVERGLLAPQDYAVEVDYSQAAVWYVAQLFHPMIEIKAPSKTKQPDAIMYELISKLDDTHGLEVDVDASPDIAPLLMLVASQCEGSSIIRGTARLRFKESDRVASTLASLQAFGVSSIIRDDEVIVKGPVTLKGSTIDSYQDHRIVMMSSVAATIAKGQTIITNAQAITKSYPDFFQDFAMLGGIYEILR
jgi:3-phosphoshikimate 1-carboxyvinyltransferase